MIDFKRIAMERPIGSKNNSDILRYLKTLISPDQYRIISLPLNCNLWRPASSFIRQNSVEIAIFPSPFSRPFFGTGKAQICPTWDDVDDFDSDFMILEKETTSESLMPKDFPFYFPDTHQKILHTLEHINPQCIITLTGQQAMSGLNPFPLFEDGGFQIPSAYLSDQNNLDQIDLEKPMEIQISSHVEKVGSEQVIFHKKGKGGEGKKDDLIIICAHLDTKYGTQGALDNASGIYTLMRVAQLLESTDLNLSIDFVPFNGEEYYGVSGQLSYLDRLQQKKMVPKAVINIDSVGFIKSRSAISFYNGDNSKTDDILRHMGEFHIVKGEQWFAGDHSMFVQQGIPCMAITSSNLFEKGLKYTHTYKDKFNLVDLEILECLAHGLVEIVKKIDQSW